MCQLFHDHGFHPVLPWPVQSSITLVVAKFCRLLILDMVTLQEAMQQQLSDHDGDADRHARLIELRSKLADVVNAKVTTGLRSSSSSRQS